MELSELKKIITACNTIDEIKTTMFNELKKEIKSNKNVDEIKQLKNALKGIIQVASFQIKKILIENPPEPKPISRSSIDRIAKFINEEIFPRSEKEIKTSVLYDRYKKWNKKDPESTKKTYTKNKFYKILKLGKRVTFKHALTGDYFIFELNEVKYDK
jgi:hypothetical protein